MSTWLVTGGAGYVGAHVVRSMLSSGRGVVVLDDLSSGFESFVPDGVPFVRASILDPDAVRSAVTTYGVDGVVHLAGWKYAGVSVQKPLEFYRENVNGTQVLLDVLVSEGVDKFVFSSSASVYGTPDVDLVTEETRTAPESPYGETKLAGEWMLRSVARKTGMRQLSLRYFNVVGSGSEGIYDASPHNLFPLVLRALAAGRPPKVFGTDYDTPDGSCVRDYVHVVDVAEAHVVSAAALESGSAVSDIYNVGRGEGTSVLEILDAFRRALGEDFPHEVAPRRPGDPARIVGSTERIARELDWKARFDLDDMVTSAIASPPPTG